MTEPVDPREGSQFYLNAPERLDDPFPDLRWFLEHRPVFFYPPLNQWFVFNYDDVAAREPIWPVRSGPGSRVRAASRATVA